MLPSVQASGFVVRDAEYKPFSEKGGFIQFYLSCEDDNPKMTDCSPVKRYPVSLWSKDGAQVSELTTGKFVCVVGVWEHKLYSGKDFHSIKASRVYVPKFEGG